MEEIEICALTDKIRGPNPYLELWTDELQALYEWDNEFLRGKHSLTMIEEYNLRCSYIIAYNLSHPYSRLMPNLVRQFHTKYLESEAQK